MRIEGGTFFGFNVIVDPLLPRFKDRQYRFPRSKKKRIRKKWANNDRNFRQVRTDDFFIIGGDTIVCRSEQYVELKKKLHGMQLNKPSVAGINPWMV